MNSFLIVSLIDLQRKEKNQKNRHSEQIDRPSANNSESNHPKQGSCLHSEVSTEAYGEICCQG
jgi:hypothetical protein